MKKLSLASKLMFRFAPVVVLAGLCVSSAHVLLAQAAPSDQITIKDPAEFNAYQNAITQTDAKAKASASESFLSSYPQSVVKKTVLDGLVDAYATFDQAKTVDAATRLLQLDPNNLKAMYLIAFIKKQQASQAAQSNPTQQAQLLDDAAVMAQKGLAATKPADVKQEDFDKQKLTTDPFFHSVLAYDDIVSKKDLKGGIGEFRKELEFLADKNPDATKVAPALNDTLILGQTYLQLTPPDPVNAVWFLSRAEDFAPDNFKPTIDKTDAYWYKRYHGSNDGFADIKTKAAATVFPPSDYSVKPADTPQQIADKVVADTPDLSTLALGDKEYILANASKDNAEKLWALLKDKETEVPGTVIAATTTQIQVAVTDDAKADKKADFTVNMKEPLKDSEVPAVGSDIKNLIGVFDSYTQATPAPAAGAAATPAATPAAGDTAAAPAAAPATAGASQIILRDGELQVEKKKAAPVHKPAAGHKKAS